MDQHHLDQISKNRLALIQYMKPDPVVDYLCRTKVLSAEMVERIKLQKTKEEKVKTIIDMVQGKGIAAFEQFCNALIETGQRHIVELICPERSQTHDETSSHKSVIEQASGNRNDEEDGEKLPENAVLHDHAKLLEGRIHGEYTTEDALSLLPTPTKSARFETVQVYTDAGAHGHGKLSEERSSSLLEPTKWDRFDTVQEYTASGLEEEKSKNSSGDDVSLLGGRSDLHLAAIKGDYQGIISLIDKGADVNLQEKDGKSCLHIAAEGGFADIVSHLIGRGADINLQDNEGRSSIYLALENRHGDIATMLYDAGAKLPNEGYRVSSDDKEKMRRIIQENASGLAKKHSSLCGLSIACAFHKDGKNNVPYFVVTCNDKEKETEFPSNLEGYAVLVRKGFVSLFADNEEQPGAVGGPCELSMGSLVGTEAIHFGFDHRHGSLGMFTNALFTRGVPKRDGEPNSFITCYHAVGTYDEHVDSTVPGKSARGRPVYTRNQQCGVVSNAYLGNYPYDNQLYGVDAALVCLMDRINVNVPSDFQNNGRLSFGYHDIKKIPLQNNQVYKYGNKTGFTSGTYFTDDEYFNTRDGVGAMEFFNMIAIKSNQNEPFAMSGDSGAAAFVKFGENPPQIIGLVIGQKTLRKLDGSIDNYALVCNIIPTLKALALEN